MKLTIDQILAGTDLGAPQRAGRMEVVPLLGDDDDSFAPPRVHVSTSEYGTVHLRNDDDRRTIVPPGAGWVVRDRAQDHAIGGGELVAGKGDRRVDTAMCIQQTQGGLIRQDAHELLILPARLRAAALAMRKKVQVGKLWPAIVDFNRRCGVRGEVGHLVYFLDQLERELDQFVAEFERVDRQVGAVILIDGVPVGVERAPSREFWAALWVPLIRVSYGSLVIELDRQRRRPPLREPLTGRVRSVGELRELLARVEARADQRSRRAIADIGRASLRTKRDRSLGRTALYTVASAELAGQVVTVGGRHGSVRYASLCLAA